MPSKLSLSCTVQKENVVPLKLCHIVYQRCHILKAVFVMYHIEGKVVPLKLCHIVYQRCHTLKAVFVMYHIEGKVVSLKLCHIVYQWCHTLKAVFVMYHIEGNVVPLSCRVSKVPYPQSCVVNGKCYEFCPGKRMVPTVKVESDSRILDACPGRWAHWMHCLLLQVHVIII